MSEVCILFYFSRARLNCLLLVCNISRLDVSTLVQPRSKVGSGGGTVVRAAAYGAGGPRIKTQQQKQFHWEF